MQETKKSISKDQRGERESETVKRCEEWRGEVRWGLAEQTVRPCTWQKSTLGKFSGTDSSTLLLSAHCAVGNFYHFCKDSIPHSLRARVPVVVQLDVLHWRSACRRATPPSPPLARDENQLKCKNKSITRAWAKALGAEQTIMMREQINWVPAAGEDARGEREKRGRQWR